VSQEITIAIRWRDVDNYGHVNNAVYLNYLEEARDRLISRLFGDEHAWDFVVARVAIDYRDQVTQDDGEVLVRCAIAEIGTSSLRTKETVFKADGSLAAEAESVVVPREAGIPRSRPLTPVERSILETEIATDA
jgi:acyl-CoA thioester hydrolase